LPICHKCGEFVGSLPEHIELCHVYKPKDPRSLSERFYDALPAVINSSCLVKLLAVPVVIFFAILSRVLGVAMVVVICVAAYLFISKSDNGLAWWGWWLFLTFLFVVLLVVVWKLVKFIDERFNIIKRVTVQAIILVLFVVPLYAFYGKELRSMFLGPPQPVSDSGIHSETTGSKPLSNKRSQSSNDTPRARPEIVRALIQQGDTSLQLPAGRAYIYGFVTGGAFETSPFASGDSAEATNAVGLLCAALAYSGDNQNSYTTRTGAHVIGGVSLAGPWDDAKAYYGSNSRFGASSAAVRFAVSDESLVVVIASAASQRQATLSGIPGLQIDASSSNGILPLLIGHTYLEPGTYTASETSSAVVGQDRSHMADLIGVFVFGFHR